MGPRGPFRNYRRKSTDLKMSWSTKRRNSRPSLRNSTRPSPRCPATKSLLSNPRILQHYFFVRFFPLPQTFPLLLEKETKSFSSVTVVFGCDDIFLCEIFASILTI